MLWKRKNPREKSGNAKGRKARKLHRRIPSSGGEILIKGQGTDIKEERTMKHWQVQYSYKDIYGTERDRCMEVEAMTISEAYREAEGRISECYGSNPNVSETAVFAIDLLDASVF